MNGSTRITPSPNAAFRRLESDQGGVILHLRSTGYFQVNEVGAAIWDVLHKGATFDEVVRHVRESFREAPEDLEEEVVEFLRELETRELIGLELDG